MPFAAFDLHKKEVEPVILSDLGEVTHRERFPTTRDALLDFAKRQLTPTTHLALEATTNTWPVVELLRPYVLSPWPKNEQADYLIPHQKCTQIDFALCDDAGIRFETKLRKTLYFLKPVPRCNRGSTS